MSLLDAPQVTPDALFALLGFLATRPELANMGKPVDEIGRWMTLGASTQPGAPKLSERVEVVRSGAEALGFLRPRSCSLVDVVPHAWDAYCDELHARFVQFQDELEVLDAYASLVVLIETEEDLGFLTDPVGLIRDHLQRHDGQGRAGNMNSTKWTAWKRWMIALGLGMPGLKGVADFVPHPAPRLERVVQGIPELPSGNELRAEPFLNRIGRAMPYLDNGDRCLAAWKRAQKSPENRPLSHVLSTALRDLHRRQIIELRFAGGDRTGVVRLAPGGEPESFTSVRIPGSIT
jgi:hypothetical protein